VLHSCSVRGWLSSGTVVYAVVTCAVVAVGKPRLFRENIATGRFIGPIILWVLSCDGGTTFRSWLGVWGVCELCRLARLEPAVGRRCFVLVGSWADWCLTLAVIDPNIGLLRSLLVSPRSESWWIRRWQALRLVCVVGVSSRSLYL